ncbi:substrate-binding domain-containing protein [Microbacterium sp. NPDC077486]|uniref:substrate-binding domain-containing protein n=1 Tax=Microbacterium sp. NPDC077486 TaxID=3154766 RepID=UPI00341CF5D9
MTDERPTPRFGLSRRERILDELRRTGAVRVAELARDFGVAELTIRRDITALADRGLLTRVHGGAVLRSALDTTVARAALPGPQFRIGMVVPSLSYYWPQVVVGARSAGVETGVQLVLRGASYAAQDQRRQIAALLESGTVHGLIVAPETQGADGHALLSWLDTLPVPVVLVERRTPPALALTRMQTVATDHAFGGALAAGHLAALGHRRVGVLTSPQSPTSAGLRQGWSRAVAELGLAVGVDRDAALDRMEGPAQADVVSSVLAEIRDTGTTALLVHSDPQALLLQQHLQDAGWRLPDDLSLIAYDDEVAEHGSPPLTALRPPKQHVGRRAVELLRDRLREGTTRPAERVEVAPALHVRASTAPPR